MIQCGGCMSESRESGSIYIVIKEEIMNLGTPSVSFAQETNVIFRESTVPFDTIVKDWLSDNHNYLEVSQNRASRSATFKRACNSGTSTSPSQELLDAIAHKLLRCPKCKCQVATAENYKARLTAGPHTEGMGTRTFASVEVTLVCYKCGSETRVDNWKDHLSE